MRLGSLLLLCFTQGCLDTRSSGPAPDGESPEPEPEHSVTVDLDGVRAVVARFAYGLHSSVYDNALHEPSVPELLQAAGIALLRYPGGGYADNYHWSEHSLSPFHSSGEPSSGYLAEGSDFPAYMRVVDSFGGAVMITVNYGTNLAGDGPGVPEEAVAWVAYANGETDDERVIGVDENGVDWQTVGYWASLRASAPDEDDPERNFLRISREEPFGVEYLEIGNEVFGNGYYGQNYEEDLHVPYGEGEAVFAGRQGNPALSGVTYGAGVARYAAAMKAVDPTIRIGAVLNSVFDTWGSDWNTDVLSECGTVIDFGVVHFYPGQDPQSMLAAPRRQVSAIVENLREQFTTFGGDDPGRIEIAITEVGSSPNLDWSQHPNVERHSLGLFALDAYLSFLGAGVTNVDWLELHNGTFLSERSGTRGPAYYGIELAHRLAGPGDALIATTTSLPAIVAHASRRADGRAGILVSNTQPRGNPDVEVTLTVHGGTLAASGERYDFAPSGAAPGTLIGPAPIDGLNEPFTLTLAPYQATLVIADLEE